MIKAGRTQRRRRSDSANLILAIHIRDIIPMRRSRTVAEMIGAVIGALIPRTVIIPIPRATVPKEKVADFPPSFQMKQSIEVIFHGSVRAMRSFP